MSSKKKRIVVVDDDVLLLEALKDLLTESGYEVACAKDREEILIAFRQPADLVLLDVNLKGFSGDDAAVFLRNLLKVKAPIYFLSGLDAGELSRRAKEAEIEGYISKEGGILVLLERIKQIV